MLHNDRPVLDSFLGTAPQDRTVSCSMITVSFLDSALGIATTDRTAPRKQADGTILFRSIPL